MAALKTASYTAEGPVLIGAALAGAGPSVEAPLRQLRRACSARRSSCVTTSPTATPARARPRRVDELVTRAGRAIADAPLEPEGAAALLAIAEMLRPGAG